MKLKNISRIPAQLNRAVRQRLGGDIPSERADAAVEILSVSMASLDETQLLGANLDMPPGKLSAFNVPVSGWVVSRESPIRIIQVVCEGVKVASGPPGIERPDVAGHLSEAAHAELSGFLVPVKTLGLNAHCTLEVYAVLENKREVLLGTIEIKQALIQPGFKPGLNPLLVTFFGRTGSTWVMRLLAEHPQIVMYRQYPYEVRVMRYWLHMLRVLSAPADYINSMQPVSFTDDEYWIGQNPFFIPDTIHEVTLKNWLGQEYTDELAGFCLKSIDTFYRHLMEAQERTGAAYFAEKSNFSVASRLVWQFYDCPREIVLVRDPRDVFASVQSFNAKRGRIAFKYDQYESPQDYLAFLRERTRYQLWVHRKYPESYLLRYEDLILRPTETLTTMLNHLHFDSSPESVAGILERASQDTPEMAQHRTSESPASSIGRWKRDLSPDMQDAARSILGDVLEKLGYEV